MAFASFHMWRSGMLGGPETPSVQVCSRQRAGSVATVITPSMCACVACVRASCGIDAQIDEARALLYRLVNQREYELVHGRNNRGEGKILVMRTGNRPLLGASRGVLARAWVPTMQCTSGRLIVCVPHCLCSC